MTGRTDRLIKAISKLAEDATIREGLLLAVEKEEVAELLGEEPMWTMYDVGLAFHMPRLVAAGIVEEVGWCEKGPLYRLIDRRLVKKVISGYARPETSKSGVQLPPDLFDNIVGYDGIKKAFIRSLTAPRPVHILLVGPPASAKSLFLEEIERLPGAVFITAGTSTRAGIRDIIFNYMPRYLLIDELDKVNDVKDLSALLTWMESNRIVKTTYKGRVEKRGLGWVFAAANREERIPWEIRSRFLVFKLRKYTREEFVEIATAVLVKREGVSPDLARHIAEKVSEISRNVRDAVKVARLVRSREEVDEFVNMLKVRS